MTGTLLDSRTNLFQLVVGDSARGNRVRDREVFVMGQRSNGRVYREPNRVCVRPLLVRSASNRSGSFLRADGGVKGLPYLCLLL